MAFAGGPPHPSFPWSCFLLSPRKTSKTPPGAHRFGGGGVWAREVGTICPLAFFFPSSIALLDPIWGQCQLWCGDVFPYFKGISGGFGVLEPQNRHLSFSSFKGKMDNFEAKKTIKQGKKRQEDRWYPFRACTGGGGRSVVFPWS